MVLVIMMVNGVGGHPLLLRLWSMVVLGNGESAMSMQYHIIMSSKLFNSFHLFLRLDWSDHILSDYFERWSVCGLEKQKNARCSR